MTEPMNKQGGRLESGEVQGVKHRVPPKNEGRVLLEVVVTPQNGTVIAGSYWPHGKSRQVVYLSQLPEVMSRVASPEEVAAWERAVATHRKQLDQHIRRELKPTPEKEADPMWQRSKQLLEQRYGGSPSVEYCRTFPNGKPPIESVVELDRVGAPETPENQQKNLVMQIAETLAAAIGKGGAVTASAEVEALRTETAQLREQVALLLKRLDAPASPPSTETPATDTSTPRRRG